MKRQYIIATFFLSVISCTGTARISRLENDAAAFEKTSQWSAAIKLYTKLIIIDSLNADYYFQRGYCSEMALLYNDCIPDFTKVIQLAPEEPLARTNRGYAYRQLGEYQKALADFSEELTVYPNPYSNEHIAMVHYLTGNYEEALKNVTISIQLDSANCIAYKTRALIYAELKDSTAACEDLEKAKALDLLVRYPHFTEELNALDLNCSFR